MRVRQRPTPRVFAATMGLAAVLCGVVRADEQGENHPPRPFTAEQLRFFELQVQPILAARCLKCHGRGAKVRGGFRLDSRAAVLKGGDLGPAVALEQPEQSLLLQAIRYEELEMPPGGKLPAGEVETLTRWVNQGLPWNTQPAAVKTDELKPPPTAPPSAAIAAARREWSHQPVVRPPVPPGTDPSWGRNPIDAFIPARLEAEGLGPAPEADRLTLIRRLTYDLIGLPPTPEDADAFLEDRAPGAYERLVERLLGSPQYGERWARHWLDLVRYGETNGYE